jgi:hypothetical protein
VLSKLSLAWVGALTVLPHLALAAGSARADGAIVALAGSLPTVSIESICHGAQAAALPESKAAAYQACVHDERTAFDELRRKWARYSVQSRMTCAEPSAGVAISYVELQTCLDMQSGGSLTGPGPGGATSLDAIPSPSPLAPGQTK